MEMANRTFPGAPICYRALAAVALSASAPSDGLVIYRFGGEDRQEPPEVGQPGVHFEQRSWGEVSDESGGRAFEVAVDPGRISALERDPSFNIAPFAELEGGLYWQEEVTGNVWDGDSSTVWKAKPYLCATTYSRHLSCVDDFGSLGTANVIFGSLYKIDRIRVVSGLDDPSRVVQAVRVFLSREPPGYPWHPANPVLPQRPWVAEVRDNREQILEIPIPPHDDIGFFQVALQEHVDPWEVHDIEVYAKGFVQRSTYITNILDLDLPMALGELRWSGSKGEKAAVQVQTRSGLDDDPVRYFRFSGRGQDREEVSRSQYGRLGVGERAGTAEDQQQWSAWAAYSFADSLGTPVTSPGPRRFFQVRVDFVPRDDDGGQVEWLEFRASPPVAEALVGEVWPAHARVGEATVFTYALRPTIDLEDPGFDRLELQSQSPMREVRGVRLGDTELPYEVEAEDPHRLVISFPPLEPKDSGALIEVDFEARVLRYGARFEARVWNSELPLEVPQTVSGGDASLDYGGNRVSVTTTVARESLLRVEVSPSVVTPNGDGANDAASVEYEIFEITGEAAVEVEIWNLSGRRVRVIEAGSRGIGRYELQWEGRDEAGATLPPGIYLCRVTAGTDSEVAEQIRPLHLAY